MKGAKSMPLWFFPIVGYFSGSVLFARLFTRMFGVEQRIDNTDDHNPGTANAFKAGGFWCGTATLTCDLLKGFLPVWALTTYHPDAPQIILTMTILAPILGHAFPVYFRFQGGKAIAVTFGSLLGIQQTLYPFALLCLFFILFSAIIIIQPHYHRTIATYLSTSMGLIVIPVLPGIRWGFWGITGIVLLRMKLSPEERDQAKVRFLWTH